MPKSQNHSRPCTGTLEVTAGQGGPLVGQERTRGNGLFVWTLCGLALFGIFMLVVILLE